MNAFDAMLNWKLRKGSHAWPGPDGGTCINEAALVAAGFPYRAIRSVDDCPPCFSRSLAGYLLALNDQLNDGDRQQLIRFVARLAGSADTDEIEKRRDEVIVQRTLDVLGPALLATRPTTLGPPYGRYERSKLYGTYHRESRRRVLRTRLARSLGSVALRGAGYAAQVTTTAVNAGFVPMSACVEIAEAAFAIGTQSNHLEHQRVVRRKQEMLA